MKFHDFSRFQSLNLVPFFAFFMACANHNPRGEGGERANVRRPGLLSENLKKKKNLKRSNLDMAQA